MKSFLWRMRSNIGWFLAAMAVFAAGYVWLAYANIHYADEGTVYCLKNISPIVPSYLSCLAFFFIYAKRYTFEESYLYGESRRGAWGTALGGAAGYAVVFACYALGTALFVRRGILSAPDMPVSVDLYRISARELFYNFAYLVVINLIAYESANLLRKFKTWKFWLTAAVCIAALVLLYIGFVVAPQESEDLSVFNFWKAMFFVFGPLLALMIAGDAFMTRGRTFR